MDTLFVKLSELTVICSGATDTLVKFYKDGCQYHVWKESNDARIYGPSGNLIRTCKLKVVC